MRTTVLGRFVARHWGVAVAAFVAAAHTSAAQLDITVVDEQGRPIENVAVYATPAHAPAHDGTGVAITHAHAEPDAAMDQKALQFAPHLLVVQAGTSVTFPNSDAVSHHVYSI